MKFAIVNGERSEAVASFKGICAACGSPTVAKCGNTKIHHWAHKSKLDCDRWWENETEWHREWKNRFPITWQEIVQRSDNGDFHRADVQTENGWVLEFQYSAIDRDERLARIGFYQKLVWVVHGSRRKKDRAQFFGSLKAIKVVEDSLFRRACDVVSDKSVLVRDWSNDRSPVLFDFGEPEVLWCLLPSSAERKSVVVEVLRERFVEMLLFSTSSSPDILGDLIRFASSATSAEDLFLKFHYLRREEERRKQLIAEEARRRNPYRDQRAGRRF